MTTQQKHKVTNLKNKGLSYGEISKALGIPRSTVSSFLNSKSLKDGRIKCLNCGKPFNITGHKTKKFCCKKCRKTYNNSRVQKEKPYSATCVGCGKTFNVRSKNERKYCSHACYIKTRFGGENHD